MTEESMNYDGQPPFFRCWSADGRDGATQEMALGSENYDDKLATFIALLANSTPQLARGYLEAQETLRKQTLLWQALGDNTDDVEDLTRDRDEYKQQHDNALASWATDRKNLEDAAHRSRCDLLDEQAKCADLTRQLAEVRAEIERLRDLEQSAMESWFDQIEDHKGTAQQLAAVTDHVNELRTRLAAVEAASDEACDFADVLSETFNKPLRHVDVKLIAELRAVGAKP